MLAELTGHKPALKVLNKQDLADPERTPLWLDWYNAKLETHAIALDASDAAPARKLIDGCRKLAPTRVGLARPMRVLICGIPNVGKSTLINTLTDKRQAKTGDEAGVTKVEQRIVLADDFYLWDTPGMLWPRIIVDQSGDRLAASGAIGRNAYDEESVVLDLIAYLKGHYAAQLNERYKLGLEAEEISAMHDDEVLEKIARKRGAVLSGGKLNLQKASEIVLTDFRGGVLGRLSLETPTEFEGWLADAAVKEEARALKKAELDKRKVRKGASRERRRESK